MEKLNQEQIENIIHNLNGVLQTSKDHKQRVRVSKDINYWKSELLNCKINNNTENHIISDTSHSDTSHPYSHNYNENTIHNNHNTLQNIPIENISPIIKDNELNELYSYIQFLDKEYIIAIDEYELKLAFNHLTTRNNLQNVFNDIKISIKNYILLLEQAYKKQNTIILDSNAISKNKCNTQAEYRNLLSKIGSFLINLKNFIHLILNNYENGGNFILNPNSIIKAEQSFSYNPILSGKNIIDGLTILQQFINELIKYFNFQTINQINKNNP